MLLISFPDNQPISKAIFSERTLTSQLLTKTLANKDIILIIEDAVTDLEKEEANTNGGKISFTFQNSKSS